ncbi:MAG: beta-lactamase family protein [Gemmatimonadales bacterium]|nr:beta-lactamase family protein [Candidatus Palauibacter irciniicola]MYC19652.1 beta-lactamase family protein [Gemmatimonadales bacterium]
MNKARTVLIAWTSAAFACAPPPTPDSSVPEGVADGSPQALVESSLMPAFTVRGEPVVRSSLADRMAELGVPGVSIAVLVDGEIAWARGYGLADVESARPVTPNTLFQAASISKPVAALAALRLVESGRVDLDGDVNAHLTSWQVPGNEFTEQAPVTLRGLLTHRAGLTVWGFPGYGPDEEAPDGPGVLDGHGNTDPVRVYKAPGESWRYSGGGYTVMQQLVADLHGKPFAEVMREEVLDPIGMARSTYEQPISPERRDDIATGYRPNGDRVPGGWHTYPEQAAAGLWTTPSELALYAREMQHAWKGESTRVLGEALAREMLTPDADDWGLGPAISEDGERFRHGGSNQGFRCTFAAYIDGDDGVFVMTNSDSGSELAAEIAITVAHAYGWSGPRAEERAPGEEGTERE